jgi:hypothetical protein
MIERLPRSSAGQSLRIAEKRGAAAGTRLVIVLDPVLVLSIVGDD